MTKLNKDQVAYASDQLSNTKRSVRSIAKELGVHHHALQHRLKKAAGTDYLKKTKGEVGSTLRILKQDILPHLSPKEKAEYQVDQWLTNNHHLLLEDQGLLTDAQLDRRTIAETHKTTDYREMYDSSEYLHAQLVKQYETIPLDNEDKSCIPSQPSMGQQNTRRIAPFISITDLAQVLREFQAGTLDNCDDYMDRLYRPCREFVPGNSLAGQITSEDVTAALKTLPVDLQIQLEQEPTGEALLQLGEALVSCLI